jgi:hypothetical protein
MAGAQALVVVAVAVDVVIVIVHGERSRIVVVVSVFRRVCVSRRRFRATRAFDFGHLS